MNRRSRKGCLDCKRAKVKCDEVRPSCGTCYRRGYVCQGYTNPNPSDLSVAIRPVDLEPRSRAGDSDLRRRHAEKDSKRIARRRTGSNAREHHSSGSDSDAETIVPSSQGVLIRYGASPASPRASIISRRRLSSCSNSRSSFMSAYPLSRVILPIIPPGTVQSTDESGIRSYFSRHPRELVISAEFVDEMNSNILQIFQEDPSAVTDTLSAIGHIYLGEGGMSIVPVLDRRARILARLRAKNELEHQLVMHLGLCAIELIDVRSHSSDIGLPALVANAAAFIKHNQDQCIPFSSIAKYFIRALARQDILISLTQARPALIDPTTWLEDTPDCQQPPDRFMGLTSSLVPLLSQLSTLASDIRNPNNRTFIAYPTDSGDTLMIGPNLDLNIYEHATHLRTQLSLWHPSIPPTHPFPTSVPLLHHAHTHKAASLLYLHRLLNPPGSSPTSDTTALNMAHEILLHLSSMANTDPLKTALWPAMIAATELVGQEERECVLGIFDEIWRLRRTVTAVRVSEFVGRVWRARDEGWEGGWWWMDLVREGEGVGECLPI